MSKPRKIISVSIEQALIHLLRSARISTQEELKHALEELDYDVNQTKISRLLRKVGAIKTTDDDNNIIYTLPLEPKPIPSKTILSELIVSIKMNETLIVIHTNPGSASLIGRLLDHKRDELHILGTVAGDDTVFITPQSIKNIKNTLKKIKEGLMNMKN